MPVVRLEASEIDARALAWLEARAEDEHPALLYSGGPSGAGARFHVLARRPRFHVHGSILRRRDGTGGRLRVTGRDGSEIEDAPWDRLLDLLRRLGREHGAAPARGRGGPFRGGFLGYFGYDLAWLFEYGLPRFLPPDAPLPDLWLGYYDAPVVADRLTGNLSGAAADLDELLELGPPEDPRPARVEPSGRAFHREDYEAAVERVRGHCLRGDLFQADLSRRIALAVAATPIDLFKRLVRASPAPFMAYLGIGGGRAVVSSSPEEFLRLHGRTLRTRPVKGTRGRGRDPRADARLARDLLASDKDRAELAMIVDLMRNDLGRVATPGSVRVRDFPVLMTLPQVHHLFATVEAELEAGKDFWDVLAASFPPGSISGAPKPKAIEVLEIVERSRRGVYTGAIGFVEPGGNAHLNVAIRTAEVAPGGLRFGVGGGITALSDPALEFDETNDKARGLAVALGLEDLP